MKHLLLVLVFVFATNAFAQYEGLYWGKKANTKIKWGSTFETPSNVADSLKLKKIQTQLSDSIATTLYTDLIFMDNRAAGTSVVTFSLDSVDSPMDSVATLWWRFYDDKDVHPVKYWDSWYQLGGYHATETLYIYQIADSSWWRPARGGQFKVIKYDADDDTSNVNLGFYHN